VNIKTDRSAAGAHALLSGWTAYFYLTAFEGTTGWCIHHTDHGAFRTGNAQMIVRTVALPEGAKEVLMPEVPESFFWALVGRVTSLGLLPKLPGYPKQGEVDYEDRRDPGDDDRPPPAKWF
jgi:hypothetical protein